FVVADALGADAALAVDREQAERNLLLAIVADDLGNPGPLARRLEIGGCRVEEPAHDRILGLVARDVGMHVHVDRAKLAEVNHVQASILGAALIACSISAARSRLIGTSRPACTAVSESSPACQRSRLVYCSIPHLD